MPFAARRVFGIAAGLVVLTGACSNADDALGPAVTSSSVTVSSTGSPTSTTSPAAASPARAGVAATGTVTEATLRTPDGRDRTYRVYTPKSIGAAVPVPLLVALHGGTGWGAQFEQGSAFDQLAESNGFVVVYPDGVGAAILPERTRTWNAGVCCGPAMNQNVDDVTFLRLLIEALSAARPIDRARVFVAGHSNGAMMAYRLACELADKVAAIGVQAGPLGVAGCRPAKPVALLHLHGTADTNAPVAGGIGTSGISGVAFPPSIDGVRTIAAADGCELVPVRTVDAKNADVVTDTWPACRAGTSVMFVQVTGATHAWMGHPTLVAGTVGVPYAKLDASYLIVDFLLAHPRR